MFHVYNLTVYVYNDKSSYAILWPENMSGRGGNQIASCLLKFLLNYVSHYLQIKTIVLFSDNCTGQNKNKHVFSMFHYVLHSLQFCIESIEINYLIVGHTHMEVDYVHGLIERNKQHVQVYHPSDWNNVIRTAKKSAPFITVINMSEKDFYDFAAYSNELRFPNACVLRTSEISNMKMEKDTISVKHGYSHLEYQTLMITAKSSNSSQLRVLDNKSCGVTKQKK